MKSVIISNKSIKLPVENLPFFFLIIFLILIDKLNGIIFIGLNIFMIISSIMDGGYKRHLGFR